MIATPIQLRFSDCDMGGHVHNAAYLNYFESARIQFFISAFGQEWDWKKEGLIIKKNTIEYHVPTFIEDKITVEVNCSHIGNKSFTLTYAVYNQDWVKKAYGESVVVSFDYHSQKPVEVPQRMREHLEKHFVSA